MQSHPSLRYSHGLSGNPSAHELATMLACVGLAQNFAALRAFSVEGGRGHMALHSRYFQIRKCAEVFFFRVTYYAAETLQLQLERQRI